MATDDDWHWAVSNIGAGELRLWLEPWAEEFAVARRSTITMKIINPNLESGFVAIEDTGDGLIVWADGGDTVDLRIDGIPQNSELGSSTIPVPITPGIKSRELLTLAFGEIPEARLGGRRFLAEQHPSIWQRLMRRLGI